MKTIEEPIWINEVKQSSFDLKNLPNSIESEILDYLNLEFPCDDSLTQKDLIYVGQFELWGKPIKCWDFGSEHCVATVQPYAGGYYIGINDRILSNK